MDHLVLHQQSQRLFDKLYGALPHGLVVEGPIGVGVREAAKILARSMNTEPIIIEPKKSLNGQMIIDSKEGNVIIEDIRQLYEQTRTRIPGSSVYVLDTGERFMTVAAQNAFLKLLEEPRDGLHFIIATHQVDQLLPTILSRSQKISLLPVSDEQTHAVVEQLPSLDSAKKARLEFVGKGLPALLMRLASDDKAYDARVAIMSDAKTMISGTAYDKLVVIHRYRDSRSGAIMLLDDMNLQLKVVNLKAPKIQFIESIARNLDARARIAAGGNIRLQLSRYML